MKLDGGRAYLHGDAVEGAGYEDKHYCSFCDGFQRREHFRRCPRRQPGTLNNTELYRRELRDWRWSHGKRRGRRLRDAPNLFARGGE